MVGPETGLVSLGGVGGVDDGGCVDEGFLGGVVGCE